MEGARWDVQVGGIVESRIKELTPTMPVILIKAITQVRFIYLYHLPSLNTEFSSLLTFRFN